MVHSGESSNRFTGHKWVRWIDGLDSYVIYDSCTNFSPSAHFYGLEWGGMFLYDQVMDKEKKKKKGLIQPDVEWGEKPQIQYRLEKTNIMYHK